MIPRTTVTFVTLWDVLEHIGFDSQAQSIIVDYGFNNVTFGDTDYALIGNEYALECIHIGVDGLYDEESDWEHRITTEQIVARYWEVVTKDDYVNLGGYGT